MRRLLNRLGRDERGISALEFALLLPILVMFSAGTVEFGRLILLTQKLQNSSFILADLAARDRTLSQAQLTNIFLALDNLIQPFDFAEGGLAIVTCVLGNADADPMISWQRTGAGALSVSSEIGAPGALAELPDDLTITAGETIIVAEVFYDFEPLFGLNAAAQVLRKVAFFKPRLGSLETLLP